MHDETSGLDPVDWRRFLQFDAKAVCAIGGCALLLIGLLAVLPAWLRGRAQADFAHVPARTAPGIVTVCQISPTDGGGHGLFNAVNVAFDHRESFYALPDGDPWQPKYHQQVRVTYRIGRTSGMVHVDSVAPL